MCIRDSTRYWLPEFDAEEDKPLDYWVDEIEKVFDDSVEAHKISDVEVGSFLSSGVDSSYVACSAHVDKTFTVGFDNGTKYKMCIRDSPHFPRILYHIGRKKVKLPNVLGQGIIAGKERGIGTMRCV